jgi:hypothetical protein
VTYCYYRPFTAGIHLFRFDGEPPRFIERSRPRRTYLLATDPACKPMRWGEHDWSRVRHLRAMMEMQAMGVTA